MTWRIPPTVAMSQDDDGIVWVLSTELGRIVRLDEVSALIWQAADGADDAKAVVARLVDQNGWEPQDIRTHVARFIDELTACGLLEKESA